MPSRLSLIAALLLPLAVQAEPADTRALLADSLADSQAQVEAAEQAMRRSENKAVQLYAKRVLTEQQEFDHQLRALAGERPWRCPRRARPNGRPPLPAASTSAVSSTRRFASRTVWLHASRESPGTPPILTCAASPTNGWRASTTTANWPTSCVAAAPTERRDRLAQCRARTCRALWRITPSAWDRPAAWRQAGAWPARN